MVAALILAGALARAADADELVGQAGWCATRRPILLPSTRWCTAVPEDCTVMAQWCSDAPLNAVAGRPEDARDAGSESRPREVNAAPVPWLAPALLAVLAVGAAWLVFAAWRDQRGPGDLTPEGDAPGPEPKPNDEGVAEVLPMTSEPLEVILLRLRKDALLALSRSGLLTLEPGRTDREYVGALDRGRDATDLTVLVRAIELIRYARRPVPGPLVDAAVQAGERLSRREP
jgi:hypothetical protein